MAKAEKVSELESTVTEHFSAFVTVLYILETEAREDYIYGDRKVLLTLCLSAGGRKQ